MTIEYPIDENGLLILRLTPSANGHIHAYLFSKYSENSKLVQNILPLMTFETGGAITERIGPRFEIIPQPNGEPFTLKINGHAFAQFVSHRGNIEVKEPTRKLCVFETRMIGRAPQKDIPLAAIDLHDVPMPITDLHTHLSAQISGKDLIQMGVEHNIAYPTAILDRLGIDYPKDNLVQVLKRPFLPLGIKPAKGEMENAVPVKDLSPASREALQNAFSYSTESQKTYSDMEERYYMREPFTKDIRLFPDMLRKIAEAYQAEGIQYAELSSNAVTDPQWLKVIHDTLPEIEAKTHVKLRFMAGLPRTLDDDALNARIEQIKRISASPYIVGVDVFGHEINKTSHLKKPLKKLAKWLEKEHPEMILEIHAGENSKNHENVKEALQLAKKRDIRVRIIHAVHGIDDETLELAGKLAKKRPGKVLVAFCPDSNLVLNNIDFPDEVRPFEFMHRNVPSVLASDGGDLYRTSVKQTAMAGALCGVTRKGFEFMQQAEQQHIDLQNKIFDKKQASFPKEFFEKLGVLVSQKKSAPIAVTNIPHNNDAILQSFIHSGKRPIFIGGAAGSSMDLIRKGDQREISIGLKLLLEKLDPEKVYFVTGRTKNRGVGVELAKAIDDYNASHEKKFDCLLMEAEKQADKIVKGITHKYFIDNPRGSATPYITQFIKQKNGASLFLGGSQFTLDFINEAAQNDIPFGLMNFARNEDEIHYATNASTKKLRVFPDKGFKGAVGMVEYAMAHFPGVFKENVGQQDIREEYKILRGKSGATIAG